MDAKRWQRVGFAVLAVVLVMAACSGGEDDAGTESAVTGFEAASDGGGADDVAVAATAAPDALAGEPGTADESRGALGAGGVAPAVRAVQNVARQMIFTAHLTVAVTDVAAAGVEATRIIEDLGGFLFGQETVGLPEPRSVLIFKVAPEEFPEALRRLGSMGEIRTQNVSADDVTERIVDLESRIETAEVSVERLRGLIAEATTVAAIAELETQLLDRETQLEVMRGQLRTIRDQVSHATIVVTLTEALSRPELNAQITAYSGHADQGQSCPGNGGIEIDAGGETTVCFEIINTGDMPLTDFDVRDPVLELERADLIVVFGDPDATVEPGQSLILAAEIAPERSFRSQTRVTAAPVNADGEILENRRVSSTESIFIEAVDPGGLPGFADGLETSVDALRTIGGVAVVGAGVVVPFLWLAAFAGFFIWWRRRHHGDDSLAGRSDAVEPSG